MASDERRDASRYPFQSDCAAQILSPSSIMMHTPLDGQTVNITEHGVMVALPGVAEDLVQKWESERGSGRVVLVKVALKHYPAVPALRGELVWTFWTRHSEFGPCGQLGILFGLISDEQIRTLHEIVQGVTTQRG